jgi:uncharacterized OB-fold protein
VSAPVLVERCDACGTAICPPRGVCRACGSRSLTPVELTEPMRVWSVTVNHHRWFRDLRVPAVVVLAELPNDPGVRLLGALVDAEVIDIGAAVQPRLATDDDGQPVLTFAPVDAG